MTQEARAKISLVHITADSHGISTYADDLASILGDHAPTCDVSIPHQDRSLSSAARTVWDTRSSTIVHAQWSRRYWGDGLPVVIRAASLAMVGLRKDLVITMHDVHHEAPRGKGPGHGGASPRSSTSLRSRMRHVRERFRASRIAERLILAAAGRVIVFSDEEAAVLRGQAAGTVDVIPHLITAPDLEVGSTPDPRQLVMFGYIHPRKGQLIAVEALSSLPGCTLVICGRAEPQHTDYLGQILARADELGLAARVRVTGFVPQHEVGELMASSRLALCPYERIAASGSISTIIAHGLPLVAHETPYTNRLAAISGTGVQLFTPYTAEALARAVHRALEGDYEVQRRDLFVAARMDGPRATAERHVQTYTKVRKGSR